LIYFIINLIKYFIILKLKPFQILSSPIRDINHSLCRFDLDEINIKIDMFSDDRVILNTTVQRCLLEDTRRHNKSEKMSVIFNNLIV